MGPRRRREVPRRSFDSRLEAGYSTLPSLRAVTEHAMDRQPKLLELIALGISAPGTDVPYSGMATLLSPDFAVTSYDKTWELGLEVLLHFDLWPKPFTLPARV